MNTSFQAFVFGLAATLSLAVGLSVHAAPKPEVLRLAPVVVVGQHVNGEVVDVEPAQLPTVVVSGRAAR